MAPIHGRVQILADLKAKVSWSVVAVKSFRFRGVPCAKRKRRLRKRDHFEDATNFDQTSYKICTGFIVDVNRSTTFVAVHESHINLDDGDILRVCFHDGVIAQAKPFMRDREANLLVFMVDLRDRRYRRVHDKRIDRADIIVLSAVGNQLAHQTASIIDPTTESVSCLDYKEIVDGSDKWFTFGCDAKTKKILGAPIFSLAGHFVGFISGDDASVNCSTGICASDLKYGLHAESFVPNLRMAIKDKFEARDEKKGRR